MADYERLRAQLVAAWSSAREGVIAELEQFTEEQIARPSAEGGRSPLEIGHHLAQAGLGMAAHGVGAEGEAGEAAKRELPMPGDKAELLELLRTSGMEVESLLSGLPADRLGESIQGLMGEETSRLSFLHFVIGHEMYHRGQIALIARLTGLTPVLTQRIAAATGG